MPTDTRTIVPAGSGLPSAWRGATARACAIPADACAADFNGDGAVNTQDVLAFLNAWTSGGEGADFNDDGTINTQDVLAFLNAWTAGCG